MSTADVDTLLAESRAAKERVFAAQDAAGRCDDSIHAGNCRELLSQARHALERLENEVTAWRHGWKTKPIRRRR